MTRSFFRRPFDDVIACLEHTMRAPTLFRMMGPMLAAMFVTWFVYVPIHELLHVAGCVLTGGSVSRLEIAPRYGAALLAEVFPFVVPGGEYAGRLSGFDTHGSDLVYLATDFMPFALSVLIGVPLIRLCMRKRRPLLIGVAMVVGLAPFYNMPGDYYEMGSIIVTRTATFLHGGGSSVIHEGIRSDDVFLLFEKLILRPKELGLEGAGAIAKGTLLILLSGVVDVLLAFVTYMMGSWVANVVLGRVRSPAPAKSS